MSWKNRGVGPHVAIHPQLLRFVVRYRGRYAVGFGAVVAATAVNMLAPQVLRLAVDDLQQAVTTSKLLYYAGLILTVTIVSGICRFLSRRILVGTSRDIEFDLRNAFFAHLQRLPLSYFHANRTGDLMSRATNDLSAVRMMVGPAFLYSSSTGITFVIAIAMMLTINARLTMLALLPLPIITLVARYSGRAIHDRFERIQQQLSDMSAVTQEALAGVRVVRAYRQEPHELERFRRANQEYVDRNRALITLQGFFYPSMGLLMGLSECTVLWLGARDVMTGRMTVGDLVAFNAYLLMLAWPMIAFGWVTNLLQRGRASWNRMLEIMDTEPAIADSPTTRTDVTPEDLTGAIAIRHLTFAYGDGSLPAEAAEPRRRVLDDINLTISAGQTVAIVGRTGSGKSTLLSLLARLHDPPRGRFSSTAMTSAICRWQPSAGRRDSCRRNRSCSPTPSRPTSPLAAGRVQFTTPRQLPGSTRTSRIFPPATTRVSASAASRCRVVRSSAPRSRAR